MVETGKGGWRQAEIGDDRESEKQILTLTKDVEHLQYVIDELEKECEFVKKHFTKKNS